jgi:hypothetical protein
VVEAGDRVVEHLLLSEGIDEHVFETLAETVESVLGAPRPEELEASTQGQDDRADSDDGENPEPCEAGDAEKRPGRRVLQHDDSFNQRTKNPPRSYPDGIEIAAPCTYPCGGV